MGEKAKALAERFFVETSVRLHREAEGMPYTGLKPAQPLPAYIAKAEKALETGDPEPVLDFLSGELQHNVQKWFQQSYAAKQTYNRTESIEAGRQWVDAYVKYVIYVHGLYKAIQAGPEHGIGHAD
ncbi:hypothetical protein GF406_09305 [candidate division KSB1 bacterium]|nr:hypothetical protein [candidate division KSB1 bacterium]